MLLPGFPSCLLVALLAATACAQPARAVEPAPAVGAPLDLVPARPKPRAAKRAASRTGHVVRGAGRSPLIEPDPPHASEGPHDLVAAAPADSAIAPADAPHRLDAGVPVAHPEAPVAAPSTASAVADTHTGSPGSTAATPGTRGASPAPTLPEHADARPAAVPPRPGATPGSTVEDAPSRPAPLPAAPVTAVMVVTPAEPAPAGSARPAPQTDTQQYCSNIAAAAADARFAWQRKQITDLEAQLKQRVAELDARQTEVAAVLARRDAMMKKATDTVLALYAGMKPDAAAEQIAALDDDLAAALLAQLPQRKASLILNQIPAEKAAKLVAAIAVVVPPEKKS